MNPDLKIYIMASTFTAVIRLARASGEVPDGMTLAEFERAIALEVARQATALAGMDDMSLKLVREVFVRE